MRTRTLETRARTYECVHAPYERPRTPTDAHERPRTPTDAHGHAHGRPRTPTDAHGRPRTREHTLQ